MSNTCMYVCLPTWMTAIVCSHFYRSIPLHKYVQILRECLCAHYIPTLRDYTLR